MVAIARPYRHPKTGIFWIRKVIPEKLRPYFGGKREFKITLRTRAPQEAKLLAMGFLADVEHRLHAATNGTTGVSYSPLPREHGHAMLPSDADCDVSTLYSASSGETLLDLFDPWFREANPKRKTADEYKKTVYEFQECVGIVSLQSIRTLHIRQYKDALVKRGSLAAASINKRVGVIKTLLNFAKMNGFIDDNPAEGIKVRRTKAVGQRTPFTDDEIRMIFSSPVFKSHYRPKAGAGDASYWLPTLAYYTGARLEELGQLSLEDVQEFEGVWFLEITEGTQEESKSVKTEAGKRIIPLHPDLHEFGFLDFLANQKTRGRVFTALTRNRYGSCTQNWSKWWSRYIKITVGIKEEGKTFHAFRHTFAQLWRESGADLTIKDAVVGHSNGNNVQNRYGGWRNPKNGRTYQATPRQIMNELLKLSFAMPFTD